MQHESPTHGINMSALGRSKQSLNLADEAAEALKLKSDEVNP